MLFKLNRILRNPLKSVRKWAVVTIFVSTPMAYGASQSWLGTEYFNFNDLQKVLVDSKVQTVADGIKALPQELKDSFTLIKSGDALQQSSPEFPRAIMFVAI